MESCKRRAKSGREDGEDDGDEHHDELQLPATVSAPASSSPAAAEPEAAQEEVGDQDRRADQDADEHGVADVEVGDVGHLVRHDALELVAVELFEEAAGDGDGGVLGVAARGEGVRGGVVDDVDLRHREARGYGHLLDHVEEYGGVVVRDLPGPRGGEDHLVARVVADEAGDDAHYQGQGEAEEGAYRVPEPGEPDDVAEDGDEGEEGGYEQQAVAPVAGDALPEGALGLCCSMSLVVGDRHGLPLGALGLEVLPLGEAHGTGEDDRGEALDLRVVGLDRVVVVLPGEGDLVLRR